MLAPMQRRCTLFALAHTGGLRHKHPNKTIRNLSAIVQRNAEKLDYFNDKHLFISSLQLASSEDDLEREDLDFDLTLGDLSVCMEGKHLVAVTKSNNPSPPAAISTIATTDSQVPPIAEATLTRDFSIGGSGVADGAPLAPADNVANDETLTFLQSHRTFGRESNLPSPKITSSPAESHTSQIRSVDTKCSFHGDTGDGNGQSTTPDVQVAMAKSGAMATHCGGSSAILSVIMESTSDPHPVKRSIETVSPITHLLSRNVCSQSWPALPWCIILYQWQLSGSPLIPVKLSDLSPYFHLKLACGAEELGVPKSEFKKLCKNLGLIRWPGYICYDTLLHMWYSCPDEYRCGFWSSAAKGIPASVRRSRALWRRMPTLLWLDRHPVKLCDRHAVQDRPLG